jgi:hypothetical protein
VNEYTGSHTTPINKSLSSKRVFHIKVWRKNTKQKLNIEFQSIVNNFSRVNKSFTKKKNRLRLSFKVVIIYCDHKIIREKKEKRTTTLDNQAGSKAAQRLCVERGRTRLASIFYVLHRSID